MTFVDVTVGLGRGRGSRNPHWASGALVRRLGGGSGGGGSGRSLPPPGSPPGASLAPLTLHSAACRAPTRCSWKQGHRPLPSLRGGTRCLAFPRPPRERPVGVHLSHMVFPLPSVSPPHPGVLFTPGPIMNTPRKHRLAEPSWAGRGKRPGARDSEVAMQDLRAPEGGSCSRGLWEEGREDHPNPEVAGSHGSSALIAPPPVPATPWSPKGS